MAETKIHYGPYEAQCKGGIPSNAVTKTNSETKETWVLYIPTDKGALFHTSTERYVIGEGGRGSAKSTTLRWDAHLRNLMIPGHRALLLRRTFPQLENSHFAQAMEEGKMLGCQRDFNQTKHFLEYNNGSLLKFGACPDDSYVLSYLSQEWDWIGFDELTTFPYDMFSRILQSARIPKSKQKNDRKAFIRAATNPIGEGASWVKRYFIDKSVDRSENAKYKKEEWRSIKMNLVDNPHMDKEEYEQSLQMLGSDVLRRAYVDGEWLVEGQFFSEFKEKREDGRVWHVINEMPRMLHEDQMIPIVQVPFIEITRCIDWGYSEAEPGYCAWIAHLPDGTALVFKEVVFKQMIPEDVAGKIIEMSRGMRIRRTVGDPMMWAEREGRSIAHHFASKGLSMYPANNDRENGWVALHTWLVSTYDDGFGERPRMQFLSPQQGDWDYGCPYAIRTLPSLQVDPKNPRDIMEGSGVEDHAADALRYWASNWPAPSRLPNKRDSLPAELREIVYGGQDNPEGVLR